MTVETKGDPVIPRLKFYRWMSEQGRLEHRPVGFPKGDYVFMLPIAEVAALARLEKRAKRPALGLTKGEALLNHISLHGDY